MFGLRCDKKIFSASFTEHVLIARAARLRCADVIRSSRVVTTEIFAEETVSSTTTVAKESSSYEEATIAKDVVVTSQEVIVSEDDTHLQAEAAIKIQSAFRGMQARDEVKVMRQQVISHVL